MENGELIMELTDSVKNKLIELFDIEIEIMQGIVEKLPDGRTRYTLKIESEEKEKMILQFIKLAMFKTVPNKN